MVKFNLKKVWKILKDIKSNDLLEDRREYDSEDLEKAYRLTKQEAKFLYALVQKAARKLE